ncbi:MAG TPA: rhodanese-like domain-containing protein [Bryobacteraceae bacterium]|nr:rhodanese-like domain-containing protein [Bryobacteraceae bacterium]
MLALTGRPDLAAATGRISPGELAEALWGSQPPFVLDVLAPREHSQGAIAASVNIPLNHLRERIAKVPRAHRIVVHCAGGMQAWLALQQPARA